MKRITQLLSGGFLTLAVLLIGYGLFGLSRFSSYTGEFSDDRLVFFDNGFYPFFWGVLLLVISQLLRLQWHRFVMGATSIVGLTFFLLKRATAPVLNHTGQAVFPDAQLLNELIVVCIVLFGLTLADRYIQRGIEMSIVKLCRALLRKV